MYRGPMAFIPAVNTARVEMVFHENGCIIENVYHVLKGSAFGGTDLTDIAQAFRDWWDAELQSVVADDVALDLIKVRNMTTATSPAIEFTDGLPLVGGSGGGALPNNSTLAIKWTTGFAGRSFRGRTYHIGLTDNDLANTVSIDSTAQSFFAAAYEALIGAVSDLSMDLVVASFFSGVDVNGDPIPRSTAVLTPIVGAVVDTALDSQRRRLLGRGT
jgi:hypothetical protein